MIGGIDVSHLGEKAMAIKASLVPPSGKFENAAVCTRLVLRISLCVGREHLIVLGDEERHIPQHSCQ